MAIAPHFNDPDHWQESAEEMRVLAEQMADETAKIMKFRIAAEARGALATMAAVYAQTAAPIEGTPGSGVGKPTPLSTTRAAPNSAAPKSEGAAHMPGGNPDRAPASTQTHEPPAR
jgi:hypothetical protein